MNTTDADSIIGYVVAALAPLHGRLVAMESVDLGAAASRQQTGADRS